MKEKDVKIEDVFNGKSFIMYASYFESCKCLKKPEDKWELMERICKFAIYGLDTPCTNEYLESSFQQARPNILRALVKRKIAEENGKKGGAPYGNQNRKKGKPFVENDEKVEGFTTSGSLGINRTTGRTW